MRGCICACEDVRGYRCACEDVRGAGVLVRKCRCACEGVRGCRCAVCMCIHLYDKCIVCVRV